MKTDKIKRLIKHYLLFTDCESFEDVAFLVVSKGNLTIDHKVDALRYMLENGLDINIQDENENTLLHFAYSFEQYTPDDTVYSVSNFLINQGVNVAIVNNLGLRADEVRIINSSFRLNMRDPKNSFDLDKFDYDWSVEFNE